MRNVGLNISRRYLKASLVDHEGRSSSLEREGLLGEILHLFVGMSFKSPYLLLYHYFSFLVFGIIFRTSLFIIELLLYCTLFIASIYKWGQGSALPSVGKTGFGKMLRLATNN